MVSVKKLVVGGFVAVCRPCLVAAAPANGAIAQETFAGIFMFRQKHGGDPNMAQVLLQTRGAMFGPSEEGRLLSPGGHCDPMSGGYEQSRWGGARELAEETGFIVRNKELQRIYQKGQEPEVKTGKPKPMIPFWIDFTKVTEYVNQGEESTVERAPKNNKPLKYQSAGECHAAQADYIVQNIGEGKGVDYAYVGTNGKKVQGHFWADVTLNDGQLVKKNELKTLGKRLLTQPNQHGQMNPGFMKGGKNGLFFQYIEESCKNIQAAGGLDANWKNPGHKAAKGGGGNTPGGPGQCPPGKPNGPGCQPKKPKKDEDKSGMEGWQIGLLVGGIVLLLLAVGGGVFWCMRSRGAARDTRQHQGWARTGPAPGTIPPPRNMQQVV